MKAREREAVCARLGQVLRDARRRAGLTQVVVAAKVGLSPEVYGRMERGHMLPSVPTLLCACRQLGVSADEALGLKPDSPGEAVPAMAPAADGLHLSRLLAVASRLPRSAVRALTVSARAMERRRPGEGGA